MMITSGSAGALECFRLALVAAPLCLAIDPQSSLGPNAVTANAELFPSERSQLTDTIIDKISRNVATAHLANVVAFQSNRSDESHNITGCKTFPGDYGWPSDSTWNDIGELIDGSLIKTKPIASLCYNSQWGIKDPGGCSALVSRFQKFPTQYVGVQICPFSGFAHCFQRRRSHFDHVAFISGQNMYGKKYHEI
jgi:hypothetical protein